MQFLLRRLVNKVNNYNIRGGITGKILRVNLSDETVRVEDNEYAK